VAQGANSDSASAQQVNVGIVGDSLALSGELPGGWSDLVHQDMPWIHMSDAGNGGDTSAQTLLKLEANPDAGHGDQLMIVWVGSNDIANGVDATTAVSNLQSIVDIAHGRGCDTLVIDMLPRIGAGIQDTSQFNNLVATSLTGTDKLDLYSLCMNPASGQSYLSWLADGTHLDPAGQQAVATAVESYLKGKYPWSASSASPSSPADALAALPTGAGSLQGIIAWGG